MKKSQLSLIRSKVKKLAIAVDELHSGKSFPNTKLTVIKSLCSEPKMANDFVLYLAQLTHQKMIKESKIKTTEDHLKYVHYASQAIVQMERYFQQPTSENQNMLNDMRYSIQKEQNKFVRQEWGPVRVIECTDLLLIEYALQCIVSPNDSSRWAYRVAREYAERYDGLYGTGLNPSSAPMLEKIVEFWSNYSFPLQEAS